MAQVNTVLGPIHSEEMGVTMCHEHITWGPPGWDHDPEWWFHYPKVYSKCLADLVDLRNHGGETIVDCAGIGFGRDIEFYRMLSLYSGVNVVVPTGFWAGIGVYNYFLEKDMTYLVDLMIKELTEGIGDTGIKAGFIKVGVGEHTSDFDLLLHRAAARAAMETGCSITTHAAGEGLRVLKIFEDEGLDLDRVIVAHCAHNHAMDLERDKIMAKMGAWVSYDSFTVEPSWAVTHYAQADEVRADAVKGFIDAGFIDRLLLSSDNNLFSLGWSRSSPYAGKTTQADFMRNTPGNLKRVGIEEETFWRIMVENPKKVIPLVN
jgi:predicted metal-dependent phosphotriesterase family hydrolase